MLHKRYAVASRDYQISVIAIGQIINPQNITCAMMLIRILRTCYWVKLGHRIAGGACAPGNSAMGGPCYPVPCHGPKVDQGLKSARDSYCANEVVVLGAAGTA